MVAMQHVNNHCIVCLIDLNYSFPHFSQLLRSLTHLLHKMLISIAKFTHNLYRSALKDLGIILLSNALTSNC